MTAARKLFIAITALTIAACGQPAQQSETGAGAPTDELVEEAARALPAVDPTLVATPASEFTAIEPSEVGVFGASTLAEALDPLIASDVHEEGASLSVTIREEGDNAIVDVVRANMADDAVSAGHLRIEFRREPDGWYPTNAYRRMQCARGGSAGQWTRELCP